jgi:hypothetical protein
MIGTIILFALSIVIGIALAPKPKNAKPATLADFDFPTAEDGRLKPIIFGTVKMESPNNVWYGDLRTEKIREWANKITGKKVTVGHKYYVGMHNIICAGLIDELKAIRFDDEVAWTGSVTSSSQITVSANNLFGGEKGEGGVGGLVDVEFGEATQTKNTYLQGILGSDIPAYRNQFGLVFRQFYTGNTPYVKPLSVEIKRTDIQADGTAQWNPTKSNIGGDMNPVHIIRECLTSNLFGSGEPASKIDDTEFTAAANTVYSEGIGLSFTYDKNDQSIGDFIASICEIIDATFYMDANSGTYHIKLIREDYDIGTLDTYGEDEIVELKNLSRPSASKLPNDIRINFINRGDNYSKRTSQTLNTANINTQGRRVVQSFNYYGVTDPDIASTLAAREAKQASSGLFKAIISTTRELIDLNNGDVFILNYPSWGIESVVCRVIDVNYGSLIDNSIELSITEDVFGVDNSVYAPSDDTEWTDPEDFPQDNVDAILLDMPYFERVQIEGDTDAQLISSGVAYGMGLVPQSQGQSFDYDSWINYASAYEYSETSAYTPHGITQVALDDSITDVSITLTGIANLADVDVGGYAWCDSEFMKVKSLDPVTGDVTLARGVLDTIPISHLSGEYVFFIDGGAYSATRDLATSNSYTQKFLPTTSKGTLAIASATEYSHTVAERINTPYPPADFQLSESGDVTMAWKIRNRINGYSIAEQSDASQTAESGQTSTVRVYDNGVLVHTASGLTGTSYTYTKAQQRTDFGLVVTGTTSPDATGEYVDSGTNDGKPYYQKGADYNWWNTANAKWYISGTVGSVPTDGFELSNADPEGTYTAIGTATGSPVVSINLADFSAKLKSVRSGIDSYTEWEKTL